MNITAKGQIYEDTYDYNKLKTTINMSDIYSFLIKEVGTKVSRYQSDLYYDIHMIEEAIKNLNSEVFLIGLRESGVDSKSFITASNGSREYINIYKVDISIDLNEKEIKAELTEVYLTEIDIYNV